MTKEERIKAKCADAGCSPKEAAYHFVAFMHQHWDPHPPEEFKKWWNPDGFDPITGSTGGHSEARRAYPDPESEDETNPDFIWDGAEASTAWNSAINRDQFKRRFSEEVKALMWRPLKGSIKERQARFSAIVRSLLNKAIVP